MGKIVALDAGHGLYTSGKRCLKSIDANETREWYLNDRIIDKVQTKLKSYDVEVVRTDDTTGKVDVELSDRCKKANNSDADLFVSMHHNAGINGGSGGGTVVYYYDNAEREEVADKLYDYICAQTNLRGNRYDGVVDAKFYVIKNTKMPAFLVENGFMDSKVDTPIILTEEHAEKTAIGVVNFIVDELGLSKIATEETTTNTTVDSDSFLVKVIVSELNIRKDAGAENAKTGSIKDKGTYTIVSTKKADDGGTWGKLKSGVGYINISSKYVTKL